MQKLTRAQLTTKLLSAIHSAQIAGLAASKASPDDGGTCNFDAPVIILPGIPETLVSSIATRLGCTTMKWQPGHFVIWGCSAGQGNANTRGAEAARKALADHGLDTTMYYQMD